MRCAARSGRRRIPPVSAARGRRPYRHGQAGVPVMIEDQVRALFTSIADGEPVPSRVNTGLALRRGRARLRWRRAGLAGAPVLAAAAVAAVALAVGAAPFRPGPGPAIVAPSAAPRQFNPLAPYAAFGWLPSGNPVLIGGSSQSLAFQVA